MKYNYQCITLLLSVLLIIITGHLCYASDSDAVNAKSEVSQYRVAVVDLMILKRQKLSAFPLAAKLGADGLELDMGGLGKRPTFANKLANDSLRRLFKQAAEKNHIQICALSMSGFYSQSFPTRVNAVKTVCDCIHTMKQMGVGIGFLPLGVEGDLVKYPERRPAVVRRLKQVGDSAQKAGVVIAIETNLSASEEVNLLHDINSPAIKISFNFSNPLQAGRNLYSEIEILGRQNIAQIHATNKDGVLLKNDPAIDLKKVKEELDELHWSGWLVVERSRDVKHPHDVMGNFGENVNYLKKVFQSDK